MKPPIEEGEQEKEEEEAEEEEVEEEAEEEEFLGRHKNQFFVDAIRFNRRKDCPFCKLGNLVKILAPCSGQNTEYTTLCKTSEYMVVREKMKFPSELCKF